MYKKGSKIAIDISTPIQIQNPGTLISIAPLCNMRSFTAVKTRNQIMIS